MEYSDELLAALGEEREVAAEGVGTADLGVALAKVFWRWSPLLPALASAVHTEDAEILDELRMVLVESAGATFELALAMDPLFRELDLSLPSGVRSLLDQFPDLSAHWTEESTLAGCLIEWAGTMQADSISLGEGLSHEPGERGRYVGAALALVRHCLDLAVYLDQQLRKQS